jgi:hypothetical protein
MPHIYIVYYLEFLEWADWKRKISAREPEYAFVILEMSDAIFITLQCIQIE